MRYEALPIFYPLTTFDTSFCVSTRAAEWTIGVENSAKITSLLPSLSTIFADALDEVESVYKPFPNVKPSGEISVWKQLFIDAEEQVMNRM